MPEISWQYCYDGASDVVRIGLDICGGYSDHWRDIRDGIEEREVENSTGARDERCVRVNGRWCCCGG